MIDAKRPHTISGDQAAYSAALTAAGQARSASIQTAAAALRSTARGAEAGRIRGAAQAEKNFVVNEAGAWQTFVIAAAGHLETLLAAEAHAEYDLVEAVVTETAAYWMLATRAYADRMVLLAGTGSPWAQYHAAAWVAHADWVDQVAPAERDRRIAAAEAARDREIAEAEAEKNKTIAKAQAQHQRAVNGADAAYERADAEADAVLHDVHFVVVRLQLPPAGCGPPLASSLLGAAEPLLVTELLGLHDFFGELSQGFAGDGTYLGIIDSLLARKPERDELGYTNSFQRVLGETIRGWVGDQILVNATDTQLFIGTLGFSAAVVVMGWANVKMAAIGLGVGLLVGGGMNVLGQIDANWNSSGSLLWAVSQVDVGEAAGAGFLAGMQGAALGGAFGGLGALASRWGLCKYLTPVLNWGGRALAAKGVYDGVNQIADGNWLTGTGTVVLGAFSYRAAGRASICFVAGTQVVKYALPEPMIVSIDPAPPEEAANWSFSYLALAGATLAAGLWGIRGGKQRRQKDEEEARRLWFTARGEKEDEPYREQDGDDPWPETLAGDEPDDTRWQVGIDRLCEALFHGKDEPDLLVPGGDVAPQRSLAPRQAIGGIAEVSVAQPLKRKLDAPRRSKPVKAEDEFRGGGPGRWLWLAACLVISLSCLWKGLPQNPTPAASQTAPARLAGWEPQQRYVTANIEDLRVGDWVLAHNPELSGAERAELAQVDPPTWRELTLRMTKADGTRLDIQLLRPLWWIEECGAAPGKTIHLDLAELGAEGPAEVVAVEPCPPIGDPPTTGCRLVTGTFAHSSGETLDLHIDGLCDPIGVTANHPFWSEDRQAFVPAGELQVGERLRKADGTLTQVLLLEDRPGLKPVFNLEIEVEHVYFVTPEGILVHNRYVRGQRVHDAVAKHRLFKKNLARGSRELERLGLRARPNARGGVNFVDRDGVVRVRYDRDSKGDHWHKFFRDEQGQTYRLNDRGYIESRVGSALDDLLKTIGRLHIRP